MTETSKLTFVFLQENIYEDIAMAVDLTLLILKNMVLAEIVRIRLSIFTCFVGLILQRLDASSIKSTTILLVSWSIDLSDAAVEEVIIYAYRKRQSISFIY
jgi:hypothetical protein